MKNQKYNLDRIADSVMLEKGLLPSPPENVMAEVTALRGPANPRRGTQDLRHLQWLSIDNDNSRDLDQLTWAENNTLFIAIADVDALVPKGSATDLFAQNNTTSVYTPTKIYPMLPIRLSYDLTSLNENEDRVATVTEIVINDEGKFLSWKIYSAFVHNYHKLTYKKVGALLERGTPPENALEEQLFLQSRLAEKIREFRFRSGALDFDTAQLEASVDEAGEIHLSEVTHNLADSLIENFMIASNVALTRYLKEKGLPTLRRVVRVPKRWDRIMQVAHELGEELPAEPDNKALQAFLSRRKKADPKRFQELCLTLIKLIGRGEYVAGFPGKEAPGHFDLALLDYSHTTAPNRRYPDIITQRILKSSLFKEPLPYTEPELIALAEQCTRQENAATKVERRMLKSAAALALLDKIGSEYTALITGKGENGTFVRTFTPPIEGKLVSGADSLDIGHTLKVRLLSVDVEKGYIDFVRS